MSLVLKYPFPPLSDQLNVELALGTRVLHFDFQRKIPTMWCLVPEREEKVVRRFRLFGTGHLVTDHVPFEYIASAVGFDGDLVLHLFEEVSS